MGLLFVVLGLQVFGFWFLIMGYWFLGYWFLGCGSGAVAAGDDLALGGWG